MHREYRKWYSPSLGRDMEMLVIGHGGMPMLVFPTSMGRFFEFEDRGMIDAVRHQYENGQLQAFCVDSVDSESCYAKWMRPQDRMHRYNAYQAYVMNEVMPLVRYMNWSQRIAAMGCSFGGYHAMNFALKHPDVFTDCVSHERRLRHSRLHGRLLRRERATSTIPPIILPNQSDDWYLGKYRDNKYMLAAGDWDICLGENQRFDGIMNAKGIPHRLDIWGPQQKHDWPLWQRMARPISHDLAAKESTGNGHQENRHHLRHGEHVSRRAGGPHQRARRCPESSPSTSRSARSKWPNPPAIASSSTASRTTSPSTGLI